MASSVFQLNEPLADDCTEPHLPAFSGEIWSQYFEKVLPLVSTCSLVVMFPTNSTLYIPGVPVLPPRADAPALPPLPTPPPRPPALPPRPPALPPPAPPRPLPPVPMAPAGPPPPVPTRPDRKSTRLNSSH